MCKVRLGTILWYKRDNSFYILNCWDSKLQEGSCVLAKDTDAKGDPIAHWGSNWNHVKAKSGFVFVVGAPVKIVTREERLLLLLGG